MSSNCPELITGSNATFNKYRLLVERYFGRMTSVFGIVSRAFPLTYEYFDDYIRTICFLTNVHVYCQKLGEKDAEYNSAVEFMWRRRGGERRAPQGLCEEQQVATGERDDPDIQGERP